MLWVIASSAWIGISIYSSCAMKLPPRAAHHSFCMQKAIRKNFRLPKYQKDAKASLRPVSAPPNTAG